MMDMEALKQALEIVKMLGDDTTPDKEPNGDGRAVIIRSQQAGVIYGNLVSIDGCNITVENAVQMYRWKAVKGGTLLDCAEFGVDSSGCKFSFSKGGLTVFNACALIDVEPVAANSIESVGGGDWS